MILFKFIFAIFVSFIPGFLGLLVSPITSGGNVWYSTLNNSIFTPEGWVFSFIWTILYFLLGIALFLIMQSNSTHVKEYKTKAYILFAINLILNTLWSFAFFGAQMPCVASIILLALIITVLFMAREFFRISKGAFWLTIPYILWLMFAFYLNGMIIYLN